VEDDRAAYNGEAGEPPDDLRAPAHPASIARARDACAPV
jgi:hypothetical protein